VADLLAGAATWPPWLIDVPRYVGARIGSPQPAGGAWPPRVSHERTMEWLMVSGPDRAAVERAFDDTPVGAATAAGPHGRR